MSTAFPLATGKELGYHREQVDRFLDRARSSYEQGESAGITSAEIRRTAFPLKRKGYAARYVDAALDRLEEVFFERERRARVAEIGDEAWWAEARQLLSEVRGRLARPAGHRFRRRSLFATGYRRSEVDAFLDRVNEMIHGRQSMVTAEVRDVVFHSQWMGYSEDQVDALLDAVIVLILSTR